MDAPPNDMMTMARFLLLQNNSTNDGGSNDNVDDNTIISSGSNDQYFFLILFAGCGGALLLILAMFGLRQYYWYKYGVDVCPGVCPSMRDPGRARALQVAQERRRAQAAREAAQAKRQKDRRALYELFLKPYTMVAKIHDFIHPNHESEASQLESTKASAVPPTTTQQKHDEFTAAASRQSSSITDDDDIILKLPVPDKDGSQRKVDAYCAICLNGYEEGDKVVWATLANCPHAFHDECILSWLTKGKKCCPICRHLFIPEHVGNTSEKDGQDGEEEDGHDSDNGLTVDTGHSERHGDSEVTRSEEELQLARVDLEEVAEEAAALDDSVSNESPSPDDQDHITIAESRAVPSGGEDDGRNPTEGAQAGANQP